MTLDGFRIAPLTHKLESHPKFQRVEAPRAHLAVAKEIVFDVGAPAIFAEIFRRNIKRITQDPSAVAHQRRAAGKWYEHPCVRIEGDRICEFDPCQFVSVPVCKSQPSAI